MVERKEKRVEGSERGKMGRDRGCGIKERFEGGRGNEGKDKGWWGRE